MYHPNKQNTANKSSLLSNIAILLTICCLISVSQSLTVNHQQTNDPKQYDKHTYMSQLIGIQQRFKKDLTSIHRKFQQINLQLKNTNISSNSQIIFLQQTLAQQRDSIYNIQNYLKVPFALRSCQCVNLTKQQKKSIEHQIESVSKDIDQLEQSIGVTGSKSIYENPHCLNGNCAAVKIIKEEMKKMKDYAKIMNDTVTSQCCKIIHYVYRDNLVDANNWIYGNLTEQWYRRQVFERAKKDNLTLCPSFLPYADIPSNQCFNCNEDKPIFNLQTRTCVAGCEQSDKILDLKIRNCDINRKCALGKYFNDITRQCQKDLGTGGLCSPTKPFWNKTIKSCEDCPQEKPYYDPNVQSCRICTQNQNWIESQSICLSKLFAKPQQNGTSSSKQCPLGKTYSPASKKCQKSNSNQPNKGTFSRCPPQTPFWSNVDFGCYQCPDETPHYNTETMRCENCPEGSSWNHVILKCQEKVVSCEDGKIYNKNTKQCEVKPKCMSNEVYNAQTNQCILSMHGVDQVGLCPPLQPNWNSKTLTCQKCTQSKPFWNKTVEECQACPSGTKFINNKCQNTEDAHPHPHPPADLKCPTGYFYNTETKACQPKSASQSPPQQKEEPAHNCTGSYPIFNAQKQQCQACLKGTLFDHESQTCKKINVGTNTSVCQDNKPYWNSKRMRCQLCPTNQHKDDQTQKCIPNQMNAHNLQLPTFTHDMAQSHDQQIHMRSFHHNQEDSHNFVI